MATASYLVLAVTGMAQIRFNDAQQEIDGRARNLRRLWRNFLAAPLM